jgi:hypothetical protein
LGVLSIAHDVKDLLFGRFLLPSSHKSLSFGLHCPHLLAFVGKEMVAWSGKILDLRLLVFLLGSLPPPCPALLLELALHLSH